MTSYVSFLLDLAGGGADSSNGDIRIKDGTIRFAPDKSPRPKDAFTWKVSVNTHGFITIRGFSGGGYKVIATAEWRDDKLAEHHQRETTVPTFYQWNLLEQSVRRAREMAETGRAPPSEPEQDDDAPMADRRAMLRTPPEVLQQSEHMRLVAHQKWIAERSQRGRKTGLVIGFAFCGALTVVVVALVTCATNKANKVPVPSPPVAAPGDPLAAPPVETTPAPPATAEPPVTPPTTATAASFTEALALAKPAFATPSSDEISPAAAELAGYRKLQWSDVAGEPQTTLGLIAKDAQAEQGKRICVEGTINRITRRDIAQPGEPPRRVYVGGLHPDGEDDVSFVVTGSTGELVKRSRAKICGVVTGMSNGAPAVYGLFDLPENAQPIVEQ